MKYFNKGDKGGAILLNGTERECWDYIENNGIENAEIKPIVPSFK